jgi:hypothetical protein
MEGTIRPEKGGKRNHLPPGTKMNQVRTQQNHPQNTPKKTCLTLLNIINTMENTVFTCFYTNKQKKPRKRRQPTTTQQEDQGCFASRFSEW